MGYLDNLTSELYDILKDGVKGFVNSQARDAEALSYGNNIDGNTSDEIGLRNGVAHTHKSAALARALGQYGYEDLAEKLGDYKEILDPTPNNAKDSWKDQVNNEIGRKIAKWMEDNGYTQGDTNPNTGNNYTKQELDGIMDDLVMDAVNTGSVIGNPNTDPRTDGTNHPLDLDGVPTDGNGNPLDPKQYGDNAWNGPSNDWEGASDGRDYNDPAIEPPKPGDDLAESIGYGIGEALNIASDLFDAGTDATAAMWMALNQVAQDLKELLDRALEATSDWIDDALSALAAAIGLASPLIIDLNKNGAIDMVSLSSSTAMFDVDGDGFAEHTGWVGSTDGLLVYDRNADGIINNISELFGSVQEEGFAHLALLDSNADGVIDANDEKWADLQVWVDANGNGFSETAELHTLDYYDIASISLTNTRVDQTVNGNIITNEGTVTYNDTSTGKIVDAWFAYDNANSTYNEDYTLDIRALFLPSARGYGELPDLHIAMSIDNGTGGLLEMVQDVAAKDATTLFASDIVTAIKNIMYRWADVDGLNPTSRGPNVDARSLAFLEKLTGEPFLQLGYLSNPRVQAGKAVTNAFDDAAEQILARIVLQGAAVDLFDGGITYDVATDSFTTPGILDTDFLDNLSDAASLAPDTLAFWENVLLVVSLARGGEENITSTDISVLNAAINDSDIALTYTNVYGSLFDESTAGISVYGDNTDNTLNGGIKDDYIRGYAGHDTINGDLGDDELDGDDGNDIISGGYGADIIYGDNGDDILKGDQGEDLLYGGYGADTFIYNLGDGYDTIRESGSAELSDKIVFGAGIAITDLVFTRLSNNDLSIAINVSGYEGEIVIENQFDTGSSTGSIETLEFSDSSTFDLTSLNYTLQGSNSSEDLYGVSEGGQPNDVIYGNGGNDRIYGYLGADELHGGDGDDTIHAGSTSSSYYGKTTTNSLYGDAGNDYIAGAYGIDHIHGGTGNDVLIGRLGNDEYYFNRGDGNDTITETDASGYGMTDTINLGAGIEEEDVTIIREGSYNLKILIDGGQGGSITIIDQFRTTGSSGEVEYIKFDDNTVWDLTTMGFGLVATDAAETLHGNNSGVGSPDDIIYAEGGNDTIYGYLGSDQLHGGEGDDVIHAGTTSSSYYGKTTTNYLYGDAGNDSIYGAYGVDHIYGGAGNDYIEGRYGNDHYYFDRGQGNDTILDQGVVSGANNIDILHLGATISESDLSYVRDGNYNLKVLINGGTGGSINIVNQFQTNSSAAAIEYIQLSDDTQIDLTTKNFVLTGTASGETLYGTEANSLKDDTIFGEGGNDTIHGYLGADELHGGDGNDTIHAGSTTSSYYGKTTTNHLYGDAGNDNIYGAYGIDHIHGGTDNDYIEGRLGNDHYYFNLGDGNDTILEQGAVSGSDNIDVLHLGEGITAGSLSYVRDGNLNLKILINGGVDGSINLLDQFRTGTYATGVEFIQLSNDTQIDLREMNFTLIGTAAAETLYGTEANSLKDDTIYGEGGNDTIHGYLGADELHGGEGNDTIHAGSTTSAYYGKTTTNSLYGDAGNDSIYGAYGVDHIYGGTGNDYIEGRLGNDHYYFNLGDGDDTILEQGAVSGSDNIDILHLGAGITAGDLSYARDGNLNLKILINGGAGGSINLLDQFRTGTYATGVEFIELSDTTLIDLRNMNFVLTGTAAAETLYGTETNSLKDDTIYGEGGNDVIHGYLGADELHGGDGNDTLHAGSTNSSYYQKTTTNRLYGDAGNDTIYGAYGIDHIYGGAGNDTLYGRQGADQYYYAQGEGDDIIEETGSDVDVINFDSSIDINEISYIRSGNTDLKILINGGADGSITLVDQFGTSGSDAPVEKIKLSDTTEIDLTTQNYTLIGTSANETLYGTQVNSGGNDTIYGEGGNDTISGYLGSDVLHGGDGNDTIHGGGSSSSYYQETAANTLYGDAGDDYLYGSYGNDSLYGGTGSDTLTGRNGADTFYFLAGETGTDTITDFNVGQGDALNVADMLIGYDPMQDAIDDFVTFTTSGSNTIVAVDRDGTGGTYSAQNIATLNGVTGLDADDLLTNGNLIAA